MAQKSPQKVLAYDLGGTKVAVAVVRGNGEILAERRVPALFEMGKEAVIEQLALLGREYLKDYPEIKYVGIASAGPLDPAKGLLLDPTNFARNGKRWGRVPLTQLLSRRLRRPVSLDNDAAAAILAEKWVGAAKNYDNAMILTLGTGLGTGIICNGELVRAGRTLHPEGGHISLNFRDESALCGCGNLGCAEAFLSGNGFARRAAKRLGNPALTGSLIADMARSGNRQALAAFEEYAETLAVAIHSYISLFAPEIIVFTGSFANASDLFLPSTQRHLKRWLTHLNLGMNMTPKLTLSRLGGSAGVIGGAYVALRAFDRGTTRSASKRRSI